MTTLVPELTQWYRFKARPAAEAAAPADVTPAPATPVGGSRPLPALRVTRSADRSQRAVRGLHAAGAGPSGAASPHSSRRVVVPPRPAACSAEPRGMRAGDVQVMVSAQSGNHHLPPKPGLLSMTRCFQLCTSTLLASRAIQADARRLQ
jgi:hypothetical protein